MKNIRGTLCTFIILVLGLAVLGGCTPQKKLIPPPGPDPVPPDNVPRMFVRPTPGKVPRQSADVAKDVSKEAELVTGVRRAYTVVLGNAALIGVETDPVVNDIIGLRVRVAQMTEQDPRIARSHVTSEPEDVARIKTIADSVSKGRPVTDYLRDITRMIQRISPNTR